MLNSFSVRPAKPEDAGRIIKLLYDIAEVHHIGRPDLFKPAFSKYTEDEYLTLLSREDVYIFVATDEKGTAEGYAIAYYNEYEGSRGRYAYKYLYLDDLCVDSEYRRNGMGKALIDAVKDRARALGCDKIELNVWNFPGSAIDFYKDCGLDIMYTHMEEKV